MFKTLTMLALAAALGLASGASHAAERRDLTIGLSQFPSNFHPSIDAMMAKSYILAMTRRPLTVYDADWTLICLLCTQLPTFENGLAKVETLADGKKGVALTFTIDPNANWGDGTPVSSADAVFTWEVGRHPKTGITNIELYDRITAIDVKDAKTFTMHFDKLSFDYNAVNDFALLPAHLETKAFARPEEYRTRSTFETETTHPGLYNGPYRIAQVARGQHVVLEPNPQWRGKTPAFGRIVVKIIENSAALEANLLSGGIDYIPGEMGLPIEQAIAFEKRHGKRFDVMYKPGLIFEHIDVNLDNPALSDRRIRQALLYGIDRESISQQLFDGRQKPAQTNVNPLDRMHAADLPSYGHNPEKADRLLIQAGWRKGDGGLRRNAEGDVLTIELATTAGNRSRELVAQVLQSEWRKLGIDARIRTEPPRVFFGDTVSKRKFPNLAMYAWISSPENVPRTAFHSTNIPSEANGWAGQNYTGYANPRMDALIEALEVELDPEKRRPMWRDLQAIYLEDLPSLPLFFRADAYIKPKWLSGIVPTGHQYPTTLWVEDWRAE